MTIPGSRLVFASVAALFAAIALTAQVVPPSRRAATLEAAQQLLAPRDAALPETLADPFHPASPVDTAAPQPSSGEPQADPAGPRTERELLAAIANAMRPPNVITMGGQQILLFGQKRVKAGDPLTINFEGSEYTLTVTAIDRTSFTLRLNREEYTRPIK